MLKVVILLAFPVMGCMGIQPFRPNSRNRYDEKKAVDTMPMPQCYPMYNRIEFTVNREKDLMLAFIPTSDARFRCREEGQQDIELIDILFVFCTDKHPEVRIRLKLLDGSCLWTVTSQLFATPETLPENALPLSSLNLDFAEKLKAQGESTVRDTAFEIEWVQALLLDRKPKFDSYGLSKNHDNYSYVGLSALIDTQIFETLDNVRKDMQVHKMTDSCYFLGNY